MHPQNVCSPCRRLSVLCTRFKRDRRHGDVCSGTISTPVRRYSDFMSERAIDFGLGLRHEHYEEIAANPGRVSWFEALSENYMVPGGRPLYWLDRFRRDYPMALHGVSLSIGSIDPLDQRYLDDLAALIERVQPMWVSDHLCFTGLRGINM